MPKGAVAKISAQTELDIISLYEGGKSARFLAKQFGIGHVVLCRILERHGLDSRDPVYARALKRTMEELPFWDKDDCGISLAHCVAISLGHASSKGLSKDRAFRKAYAKECQERNADRYREVDSKREWHLNRISAWQDKQQIIEF